MVSYDSDAQDYNLHSERETAACTVHFPGNSESEAGLAVRKGIITGFASPLFAEEGGNNPTFQERLAVQARAEWGRDTLERIELSDRSRALGVTNTMGTTY